MADQYAEKVTHDDDEPPFTVVLLRTLRRKFERRTWYGKILLVEDAVLVALLLIPFLVTDILWYLGRSVLPVIEWCADNKPPVIKEEYRDDI